MDNKILVSVLADFCNISRGKLFEFIEDNSIPLTLLSQRAAVFYTDAETIVKRLSPAKLVLCSQLLNQKINLSKQFIIVDTNVLLKNPTIIDHLIKNNVVIIPQIVISELDFIKNKQQDKNKQNARLAIATINQNKSSIKIEGTTRKGNTQVNDDLIIEVAKRYQKTGVTILTNDSTFETKCLNIEGVHTIGLKDVLLSTAHDGNIKPSAPLFKSLETKNYGQLKKLVFDDSCDINAYSAEGYTPLISAIQNRDIQAVSILLTSKSIDINKLDEGNYKVPALVHSIFVRRLDIMEMLLKHNVDVNQGGAGRNYNNTALMISSWNGNLAAVKLLLKQPRIAINQVDSNGFTALSKACIKNNVDIVELLLKSGSDKNILCFKKHSLNYYVRKNMDNENIVQKNNAKKILDLLGE